MASLIDDLSNMEVDGASWTHGLALLSQEGWEEHPWLSALCGTHLGVEYGAVSYAKRWNSVAHSDKRDIIAALRTSGKGALIAAKIATMIL